MAGIRWAKHECPSLLKMIEPRKLLSVASNSIFARELKGFVVLAGFLLVALQALGTLAVLIVVFANGSAGFIIGTLIILAFVTVAYFSLIHYVETGRHPFARNLPDVCEEEAVDECRRFACRPPIEGTGSTVTEIARSLPFGYSSAIGSYGVYRIGYKHLQCTAKRGRLGAGIFKTRYG